MKILISKDEAYPFFSILGPWGILKGVAMTTKKHGWCMRVLKEFEEVQTYLKKRYEGQTK